MPVNFDPWTKAAVRVAFAGLGAMVGGPVGAAVGGWLGDSLGESAADIVKEHLRRFGDAAGKKLFDVGSDVALAQFKAASGDLQHLYSETLRLGLAQMAPPPGSRFVDWFQHWDACLAASGGLRLPPIDPGELAPSGLDDMFRTLLENLDAQGAALKRKGSFLSLIQDRRKMPAELFTELETRLPEYLKRVFPPLLHSPKYEQAWREMHTAVQQTIAGGVDELVRSKRAGAQPPLFLPHASGSQQQLGSLTFGAQSSKLVGREAAMETLWRFILTDTPDLGLWTVISGEAGTGKSRLAVELVRELDEGSWHAGFLDPHSGWLAGAGETWWPEKNTLIVIDYNWAHDSIDHLRGFLRNLVARRGARLLSAGGTNEGDQVPTIRWKSAASRQTGDLELSATAKSSPSPEDDPLYLRPLSQEDAPPPETL